jgi:flagellar biosynthesis GTPase FlhF
MVLRAEALALRADAMSLRADLSVAPEEVPRSRFSRFMASLGAPWQRVLVVLGTLMAIGMVMQMLLVAYSVRNAESVAAAAARAEEQAIIQEHYQTYGVRPASAAEARRLEQAYRQQEAEERRLEAEANKEERERQYAVEQERRFISDARAQAEQVANDLRNDEERLRHEAELGRAAREAEERRKLEEERQRAQREKEKWREVLNR